VADRTSNGKPLRMLNVIDEYTRECLAIRIDRKITSNDVVEALAELFVTRGSGSYQVRQRTGVCGRHCAIMVGKTGSQDALHRARESLGERIHRIM